MKNIVVAGTQSDDGLFLEVIQNNSALCDNFLYQIIEVPGVGAYARPLNPNLKNVSPKEAIEKADLIIELDQISPVVKSVISGKKTLTLKDYVKDEEDLKNLPTIQLEYDFGWRSDVLKILTNTRKLGYKFHVNSTNPELNKLLGILDFHDEEQDFKIILSETVKDTDIEGLRKILLHFARKNLQFTDQIKRMKKEFSNKNFGRNFLRLREKSTIYLTMTRTFRCLTYGQNKLLHWLENLKDTRLSSKISRSDVETLAWILNNETFLANHLDNLIRTNFLKIENLQDVIVSFLGSHRCNLRCKYCFSDHSCAALSQMSSNEFTKVCDMLTYNRPGIKIHFDNSLGGEPAMDFENVKKRNNFAISYHKCTGIPATFGLLSNGTLLTENQLKFLQFHNPYVGFSLDGDRETNDKLRRDIAGNSTYDRAINGIKLLQKLNWKVETGISCVVTKLNQNVKELQKHFREELGVPNVVMKPVRAASSEEFALTCEDLPNLTERYHELLEYILNEGTKENLKPLFSTLQPLDYLGRFLLRIFWGDRLIVKRCGCGEIIYSISDDGKVFPCDSFNGNEIHEIGNLKDGMHNKNNFRVPFVTEEKFGCNQCPLRFLCGGVCSYVKFLNNYKKNKVTKTECDLAKFLIIESLNFWQIARTRWSNEIMERVEARVNGIGFSALKDGALVYAPC